MTRMRTLVVGLVAGSVAMAACGEKEASPAKPAPIETVDVKPPLDATLHTDTDRQERKHDAGFSGVLPTGFPKDLPVYVPSTLVDFGDAAGGSYAVFQTTDPLATARSRMTALLQSKGWKAEGGSFRKGGRSVTLAVADAHPGATLRLGYKR